MRDCWLIPLLFAAAGQIAHTADNQLTAAEVKSGWHLLFDGKSFQGWRAPASETPPGDSWTVENGCLTTVLKPHIEEDLISARKYGDFELEFDWRLAPGANSGVKYRIQRTIFHDNSKAVAGGFEAEMERELMSPLSERSAIAPDAHGQEYTVGFEFQLIDDERAVDAKKNPNRVTGALYSMLAPMSHPAHPAGEWNHGRLIVRGNHIEHWINGERVLSGSLDDPAGLENLQTRWMRAAPDVYNLLAHAKPEGFLSLQHHGDRVWFKNLKIKEL